MSGTMQEERHGANVTSQGPQSYIRVQRNSAVLSGFSFAEKLYNQYSWSFCAKKYCPVT